MRDCVQLYTAVFETLTLNEEHLRRRAGEGFTTATELADALVREAGLPFRTAHKIVATLVSPRWPWVRAAQSRTSPCSRPRVQTVLSRAIDFNAAQFAAVWDPAAFIAARDGIGRRGPSCDGCGFG